MDKKKALNKLFLTLVFFYSTFCMADIDCENAQQDYQIRACESIASRLDVQKFNIEIFIFLKNMPAENECTKPEDYIPALLIYENAFLKMKDKYCDLQLVTSHNHFNTRPVQCDTYNREASLFANLKESDLSPFDCTLPGYADIIKNNASIKEKPGFDCKKASTKAETAICFNAQLARLDLYSSLLYNLARNNYPNKKEKLLTEQRYFLKQRDPTCGHLEGDEFEACVTFDYQEHINWLEEQFE